MRCHAKTMRCHANHMICCIRTPQKTLDVYQTLSLLEGGVWERDYQPPYIAISSKSVKVVTFICAHGHNVAHGWKTLEMYGFLLQTYGKCHNFHSEVWINVKLLVLIVPVYTLKCSQIRHELDYLIIFRSRKKIVWKSPHNTASVIPRPYSQLSSVAHWKASISVCGTAKLGIAPEDKATCIVEPYNVNRLQFWANRVEVITYICAHGLHSTWAENIANVWHPYTNIIWKHFKVPQL